MESKKKLTIGYIGNGKSANRYHIPFVLTRKEKYTIKTIYCRHPEKNDWAKLENVQYTDDLERLLNDPEIDLVVVCTTLPSHYSYARLVLEHGKHCLVEKPFVTTYAEAKELFTLAQEKNLFLSAYQNRRYDSDFLTVQKVIQSGILGEILEVEMHFDYYRPEVPQRTAKFEIADSFLYSHACHTLDQVISFWGEPDSIHYDVRQLLGQGRMNDYFDLDLYYGITKVSVKSSYFRAKSRPSFVVYGKKGLFIKEKKDRQEEHLKLFYLPGMPGFGEDAPEDFGRLTWYDEDGNYHDEAFPTITGDYARVYDDIYETIMHGAPQVIRPEQTMLQIQMLEKGIQTLTI